MHEYLTVIECKDYSGKVPVEKIDAFVTKARDAQASKAIIISSNGFQSGCIEVAERHGLELLVLKESTDVSIPELIEKITPALNISRIRFSIANSKKEYELEDWGGRLAYLSRHSEIIVSATSKTLGQLIHEWQITQTLIELGRQNEINLPLPDGTILKIPYESPISVSALKFNCTVIEAAIPKAPILDNHIIAQLHTTIELRDPKGALKHSAPLASLELGFDKPVEAGKFYEQPIVFSRYYCSQIDGEIISWTLLESYQHGHLFQAKYTQMKKEAKHYVEVIDEKIINRLRKMLEKLNQ